MPIPVWVRAIDASSDGSRSRGDGDGVLCLPSAPGPRALGAESGLAGATAAIIESALDCIVAMGADGRVVEWNPAAERTFGYTRERALGRLLADLIVPPALREAHTRGLARYLATGERRVMGRRLELEAVREDGSELPVELTITRVESEPPLFIGYLRDIAERKRQEAVLRSDAERRADLVALGNAALQGAPLPDLMEQAIMLACRHLGLDFCAVWELALGDQELLLRSASGWPEELVGSFTLPVSSDVLPGYVLACAKSVVVPDFEQERRFVPAPHLRRAGVRSGLGVGISGSGRPFGVLAGHSLTPRAFDRSDLLLLESLANVLGPAIQRLHADTLVEQAEHRYRTLVERLPVVTYAAELGPTGRWLFVSPQIERMTGFTPEEWIERPELWFARVHPDDKDRVAEAEAQCGVDGSPLDIDYRLIAKEGHTVWVHDEALSTPSEDGGPGIVEGVLVDITDERLANERLRYHADHDVLTGLFNRRRFEEELERCRSDRKRGAGAVLVLDVDHFKFVNDSLGHSAGDAVLSGVAGSIRECVGPAGVPARLGGDEFAVLLPGADEVEARSVASRLLRAVRSRETRIPVTASVGFAAFDADSAPDAGDLMVAADIALYDAKEAGRDRVALYRGQEGARLAWVGRLRQAIDDDRLLLHAQPIFELASGRVVAEELLVRVVDEHGDMIPPAAFLPTAERFGLIRDIDRWAVSQAVELAVAGRRVSVNISARSLADSDLTRLVAARLAETGADPSKLVFEITETAAAAEMQDVRDFAGRVERLGCGLALDDFGTGFGTFTYLKHLPVTHVKIDMEFVRDLTSDAADRRLVKSIVAIARGLGVRTVAEGVEDAGALTLLRDYGVDYAQGYHLGPPMPLELPKRALSA